MVASDRVFACPIASFVGGTAPFVFVLTTTLILPLLSATSVISVISVPLCPCVKSLPVKYLRIPTFAAFFSLLKDLATAAAVVFFLSLNLIPANIASIALTFLSLNAFWFAVFISESDLPVAVPVAFPPDWEAFGVFVVTSIFNSPFGFAVTLTPVTIVPFFDSGISIPWFLRISNLSLTDEALSMSFAISDTFCVPWFVMCAFFKIPLIFSMFFSWLTLAFTVASDRVFACPIASFVGGTAPFVFVLTTTLILPWLSATSVISVISVPLCPCVKSLPVKYLRIPTFAAFFSLLKDLATAAAVVFFLSLNLIPANIASIALTFLSLNAFWFAVFISESDLPVAVPVAFPPAWEAFGVFVVTSIFNSPFGFAVTLTPVTIVPFFDSGISIPWFLRISNLSLTDFALLISFAISDTFCVPWFVICAFFKIPLIFSMFFSWLTLAFTVASDRVFVCPIASFVGGTAPFVFVLTTTLILPWLSATSVMSVISVPLCPCVKSLPVKYLSPPIFWSFGELLKDLAIAAAVVFFLSLNLIPANIASIALTFLSLNAFLFCASICESVLPPGISCSNVSVIELLPFTGVVKTNSMWSFPPLTDACGLDNRNLFVFNSLKVGNTIPSCLSVFNVSFPLLILLAISDNFSFPWFLILALASVDSIFLFIFIRSISASDKPFAGILIDLVEGLAPGVFITTVAIKLPYLSAVAEIDLIVVLPFQPGIVTPKTLSKELLSVICLAISDK
ncbi:hypothetical protein MYTO111405_04125 [Mycoplasma todarodis]